MNLKQQHEAALKAARDIVDAARKEGRTALTDDERKSVNDNLAKADDLAAQIKQADEDAALFKRLDAIPGKGASDQDKAKAAKSLGEHFVKSVGAEQFALLKHGNFSVSSPEFKAAADPHAVGASFGAVLTDVDRTIVQAYRRPVVVADLLGTGRISGNAITYYVEGAVEGGFTTVAEGGQKPQLHNVNPTPVTDSLKKIAAWWDNTDEMVEDLDFWETEINNRGLYLLALAEEDQLLNGDGTGSNVLGLLNRSGIQAEASAAEADNADAVFRGLTKVQTATGLSADGIVINPLDYQAFRLSKDGNQQYYGGGFFAGEYGNGGIVQQPPLWGQRTVITSAIAQGTVLVGAFKAAATVYRKGGVRVESTNSDAGKFTKNIVTTRVEERIALAARIPSAVVEVSLSNV